MPFFDIELNAQANRIRRSALTFRLHTAAPTNPRRPMEGSRPAGVCMRPELRLPPLTSR